MDKVGESKERNKAFSENFDRLRIIQSLVAWESPIVFDVGAHRGESVKYLREALPGSTIYSFEPDPDSYDVLSSNKKDRHYCYNMAVSNTRDDIVFYKNEISHTNSIFKVNTESKDSIKIQQARETGDTAVMDTFNKEIRVKATTLDDFISEENILNIDILKIDVQGAESMVLEGGAKTLELTKVVLMEVSFFDYYEKKTSFYDIEKFLIPKGFELFSISELSQNPMNGRTDWAEVIYTRK